MVLVCLLAHILAFKLNFLSGPYIRRNHGRHHVQKSEYFSCYCGKQDRRFRYVRVSSKVLQMNSKNHLERVFK